MGDARSSSRPGPAQPPLPAGLKGVPLTDGRAFLPFQFFKGRALSHDGLIVAAYFDETAGAGGYSNWQTQAAIVAACGISRRAVQLGLADLRSKGLIHEERVRFRGKSRKVTFLLWRVREDVWETVKECARPVPAKGARSCALKVVGAGASKAPGARSCAESAQDLAPPYPISNSVWNSKSTLTSGAGEIERTPEPPPPPAAPPPPRRESPEPAWEGPDPTPEEVADWHAVMQKPGGWSCEKIETFGKIKGWDRERVRRSRPPAVAPAPTPRVAALAVEVPGAAPPLPAARAAPPPPRAETPDLWKRLLRDGSPAAAAAAADRMVEVCKDPDWRPYYLKQATRVQSGGLPLPVALRAVFKARSGTAESPGRVFAGHISEWNARAGPRGRHERGA